MKVIEHDSPPYRALKHSALILHIRRGADDDKKQAILDEWYREQLKGEINLLIQKWAPHYGRRNALFYCPQDENKVGKLHTRSEIHSHQP